MPNSSDCAFVAARSSLDVIQSWVLMNQTSGKSVFLQPQKKPSLIHSQPVPIDS